MSEQVATLIPSRNKSNTQKANHNSRPWVSINLIGALIGVAVTGILSFAISYNETIVGLHTWFGFIFIVLMVFHLRNNLKMLITYITKDKGKRRLTISLITLLTMMLGVLFAMPPFANLLTFGQALRQSVSLSNQSYQQLTTHIGDNGHPISIELRQGPHYESAPQPLFLGITYTTVPQVAFWVEDMAGNYIDTLYVTQKASNGSFASTEELFESVNRPETLPYWAHQRGVQYANQQMLPNVNNTDLDGMTGATPIGNYDINSRVNSTLRRFKVMMEINRSYDFNDFYSKHKYPEDPIYSGSGSSGQPSVIYTTTVDLDDSQHSYIMNPVGHGHYSGADGILYADMTGIDTALQLVQRVIVDI